MIRKISDFLDTLQSEREKTITIFKAVDESKKSIQLNPNIRSLERLAWHISQTVTEMPHQSGLLDEDTLKDKPIPATFAEIISTYEQHSKTLTEVITAQWHDKDLEKEVDMYGEKWPNGKTLEVLIFHEIHHRAEMVALMRVLDMKVPGIYGPSKEDWSKYGLPEMV